MANARLDALSNEFAKLRSGIETINTRAANDGRDLTDTEQADSDQLYARAEQIRPQLEELATKERSLSATADVLARLNVDRGPATRTSASENAAPVVPWKSAGEFMRSFQSMFKPELTGLDRREATQVFERAVAQQLLADNTGLVPFSILGDLVNFIDASRPGLSAMNLKAMPALGSTFGRPRVTQHTTVGVQATQLTQLSSQKMTITYDTVTKGTYGGVLDLSQQDIDWTEPGILDLAINDMAQQYAIQTETKATGDLVAAATNVTRLTTTSGASTTIAVGSNGAALPQATINVVATTNFASPVGTALVTTSAGVQVVRYTGTTGTTLTGCTGGTGTMSTGGAVVAALQSATTPATVLQGIFNGAVSVYNSSKVLPDTLWISTDVWAWLGGLSDTTGRPATNQKNGQAVNPVGSLAGAFNFAGDMANISFVVAPTLATNSMVLGVKRYAEVYENRNGLLRIGQPSVLGQEIAFSGYLATYMRPEAFTAIAY